MARRNSPSASGGFLFKTGLFAALAGLAFFLFNWFSGENTNETSPVKPPLVLKDHLPQSATVSSDSTFVTLEMLPISGAETVLHTWFALGYNEEHEQAEWVAYELTRARLDENWVERPNSFRPDPDVRTESATPKDYTSSGYDKGHLCPAADMAFDPHAMNETFLMSNISPQRPPFNMGIWRELEELTRDWARKFKRLYVVTGPILTGENLGRIGFSKVTVPGSFYKVLLAPDHHRAIAFILPNEMSEKPVMEFALTIDEVEIETGINFFPKILGGLNNELEASLDKDAWPVNRKRYDMRVKQWNIRR